MLPHRSPYLEDPGEENHRPEWSVSPTALVTLKATEDTEATRTGDICTGEIDGRLPADIPWEASTQWHIDPIQRTVPSCSTGQEWKWSIVQPWPNLHAPPPSLRILPYPWRSTECYYRAFLEPYQKRMASELNTSSPVPFQRLFKDPDGKIGFLELVSKKWKPLLVLALLVPLETRELWIQRQVLLPFLTSSTKEDGTRADYLCNAERKLYPST